MAMGRSSGRPIDQQPDFAREDIQVARHDGHLRLLTAWPWLDAQNPQSLWSTKQQHSVVGVTVLSKPEVDTEDAPFELGFPEVPEEDVPRELVNPGLGHNTSLFGFIFGGASGGQRSWGKFALRGNEGNYVLQSEEVPQRNGDGIRSIGRDHLRDLMD